MNFDSGDVLTPTVAGIATVATVTNNIGNEMLFDKLGNENDFEIY